MKSAEMLSYQLRESNFGVWSAVKGVSKLRGLGIPGSPSCPRSFETPFTIEGGHAYIVLTVSSSLMMLIIGYSIAKS